jgi:hypothetical protein
VARAVAAPHAEARVGAADVAGDDRDGALRGGGGVCACGGGGVCGVRCVCVWAWFVHSVKEQATASALKAFCLGRVFASKASPCPMPMRPPWPLHASPRLRGRQTDRDRVAECAKRFACQSVRAPTHHTHENTHTSLDRGARASSRRPARRQTPAAVRRDICMSVAWARRPTRAERCMAPHNPEAPADCVFFAATGDLRHLERHTTRLKTATALRVCRHGGVDAIKRVRRRLLLSV